MKVQIKTIFLPQTKDFNFFATNQRAPPPSHPQTLCNHSSKAPSPPPPKGSLTDGLAHSCGRIHLVAVVALALVASFQVDADLTADAGVLAFVDVCARRETQAVRKTRGKASRFIKSLSNLHMHEGNSCSDTPGRRKC